MNAFTQVKRDSAHSHSWSSAKDINTSHPSSPSAVPTLRVEHIEEEGMREALRGSSARKSWREATEKSLLNAFNRGMLLFSIWSRNRLIRRMGFGGYFL